MIISAPSKDADATFVIGVNEDTFDPELHVVVSNASCTTNCLVPMVKVLDDAFGLRQGLMTTVHAYTNDQSRARPRPGRPPPGAGGGCQHHSVDDRRRPIDEPGSRGDEGAPGRPIPPGARAGRLDHRPHRRARTPSVGAAEINEAFRAASETERFRGIIVYNEDAIVSTDIIGSSASCTFDSTLTMAIAMDDSTTLAKVMGWYDNEWGYSHRLVDLARIIGVGMIGAR